MWGPQFRYPTCAGTSWHGNTLGDHYRQEAFVLYGATATDQPDRTQHDHYSSLDEGAAGRPCLPIVRAQDPVHPEEPPAREPMAAVGSHGARNLEDGPVPHVR